MTDSAGIRIASARVSEATPRWTLPPDPELEIGRADGDAPHLFQRPEFAARLSDGRVVVADFGSGQLRYFDGADGRFLASVGRRGQGPGEFQEFNRVVLLPGDTLVVYDDRNLRVTRIGPDGEWAGELSLRDPITSRFEARVRVVQRNEFRVIGSGPEAELARWRNLIFAGPLEGGRHAVLFFELVQATSSMDGDTLRGDVEVAVLGGGEESTGTVTVLPGPLRFVQWIDQPEPRGAMTVTLPVPFAPQVLLAARGDRIVVSSGERFEIRIHDASGGLRQVVRREDPGAAPEPVGSAHVEGYAAWRTTWPGAPGPEAAGEFADLLGASYRLPTHGDLHLDDEGRIWVQDYLPPWEDRDPGVPPGPTRSSTRMKRPSPPRPFPGNSPSPTSAPTT